MLYMLIERYTNGPKPIYERAAVEGRMLPEGLDNLCAFEILPVITSSEAATRTLRE